MAQKNVAAKAVIDRVNRTITVSKAFNEKASIYGTKEYDELTEIQTKHPNFRIIVKSSSRKSVPLGKITRTQIEKYIKAHDDENASIWNEYLKLRGTTDDEYEEEENEDEIRVKVSVSFFEIKKWFAMQYPCFKEEAIARKKEIKKIMEKEVV